ncbi:MAG: MGMT family protein [Christensenellales bacterium]|jgi:methylated-DNA-protein-cysteine methyltransferase-like protein
MGFFEEVYSVVKKIPSGRVATYGDVAALCGKKRAARQVGWALHQNPSFMEIPCHRVVSRVGRLAPAFAFGGQNVQKGLLEKEGVRVGEDFTVDLSLYRWKGVSD